MAVDEKHRKSTVVAYILYFLGSFIGLHHFYLGRDFQGFLYLSSLGGYGLGVVVDLFRLRRYVADANEEDEEMALYKLSKKLKKPGWGLERAIYQTVTGTLYSVVACGCVDSTWRYSSIITFVVSTLAVSLGVWIAGNYGRQRVDFTYPVRGTILTYSMMWFLSEQPNSFWLSIGAMISAQHNREFRNFGAAQRRKRGFCRRCLILAFGTILLLGGVVGFAMMNGEVEGDSGEKIPLHVAARNFLASPVWLEMRQAVKELWQELTKDGWSGFFYKLRDMADVDGENKALRTLELTPYATDHEIKSQYRKLAKLYHPDMNRDNPSVAAERFMEVSSAYETLMKIKSARSDVARHGESTFDGEAGRRADKEHFHDEM
ncbi:dnaJ homolog subfamily C member 22-like [Sycon ciliatum]|uniref:dnaJ homolog subfamily C member 22-like n=1 Tax=Sycon ciliatum TaxID=27933 RepID=UPI0020A9F806|eukprot:scpid67311/ scgid10365/ DnaJ homolog subfamily C member 22